MRISDWSSDVCSSDLVASGGARPAQTLAGRQAVATMQDRRSELVSNVARARATLTRWTGDPTPEIAGPLPDFAVDATTLPTGLDRHPTIRMIDAQTGQADADVRMADAGRRSDFGVTVAYQRRDTRFGDSISAGEMGRASCRERGVQYVWISGV